LYVPTEEVSEQHNAVPPEKVCRVVERRTAALTHAVLGFLTIKLIVYTVFWTKSSVKESVNVPPFLIHPAPLLPIASVLVQIWSVGKIVATESLALAFTASVCVLVRPESVIVVAHLSDNG